MVKTEFDAWTFDPVSGGGGMGQITGDFLFTEGTGDKTPEEISETIVNGNGNGNGSPLQFTSSAGGAFILGLVILAMSGFRG